MICTLPCAGYNESGIKGICVRSEKDGPTLVRGITGVLASTFYPEFNPMTAVKAAPKTGVYKRGGKSEGIRVDKYLTDWVNTGKLKACYTANPRFEAIRSTLESYGWKPLACQVPLACASVRIGTRVDMLCLNKDGRVIIVELKTGFRGYWEIANQGNMKAPFQNLKASCKNAHFLQLKLTTWLFFHSSHKYRKYPFGGAYILRVFDNSSSTVETAVIPLPADLHTTQSDSDMLEKIMESLENTVQDRKRIVRNGKRRSDRKYTVPADTRKKRQSVRTYRGTNKRARRS